MPAGHSPRAARVSLVISNRSVDLAGNTLRDWWRKPADYTPEIQAAVNVLWEYRATFQDPLTLVSANLRYYVEQESSRVIVAQRLKRLPQIINKLVRFPTQRLTQMQDIGGCRAIFPGGLPEVRAVEQRLRAARRWDIVDHDDYIIDPKKTGYRALHLIERRNGRLIEIQLRTPAQHEWAEAVERAELRSGHPLKDGAGPRPAQRYFQVAAALMSDREQGQPEDPDMANELSRLRSDVEQMLQ